MIDDLTQVAKILNQSLVELYEDGEITPDEDGMVRPSMVYPFNVSELIGVHTHQIGTGDGVWFRLRDGRVFDKYGDPAASDRAIYDTVAN
jgi:hypothetical protein